MNTETKTVETKVETAVAQPEVVTTPTVTEVDYEALLSQKDAEIAKVREEKDNYRKGLLQAKGKLPEDTEIDTQNPEQLEALIDRKVNERILSTKEAQLQAEKDSALKAVLKRNKELELALKNRGQITSTSAQGSNQDKLEVKTDSYFSTEQINDLKKRGWDDKKIEAAKQNMLKVNKG